MNAKQRFPSGTLVATRGVAERMEKDAAFAAFVQKSLQRHLQGDWGCVCQEDKEENELALQKGFRLFSAYEEEGQPKIWIITEADRSATTVLFPEEY